MQVQRVIMPGTSVESWTVVDTIHWSVVDPGDRFRAKSVALFPSPSWHRRPLVKSLDVV